MMKLWPGVRMRSSLRKLIGCAAIMCWPAVAVPTSITKAQEFKVEMGAFYLCLLVKPANWTGAQKAEAQQLFPAHSKHVQSLIASGKASIAGPFGDDTRIAGVFVLNASSAEEARAWEEADPLVKTGGFSVEVLKWWAAKGVMKPPAQPMKMTTYYFAFLRRGPKWTGTRTPETDKLQADHMAHINSMASSGKLVIAGPFENAGEYAGVFVFKVNSIDEAKALAEGDPTVKTGRLVIDIHPWLVPQGSLP
ncbi:MAG: YciI family protein [Acidobacteriota bacterium]